MPQQLSPQQMSLLLRIADPLSARKSVEPGMGLEGGPAPYRGGAGGRAYIADPAAPYEALPVGRKVPGNFKVSGGHEMAMFEHPLPSGVRAKYYSTITPANTLDSEVVFINPEGYRPFQSRSGQTPAQGRERLRDVFSSVEQFVNKMKPERLTYEAGSDKLMRLYDRITPQLAERLGGVVVRNKGGNYEIAFPRAQQYPVDRPGYRAAEGPVGPQPKPFSGPMDFPPLPEPPDWMRGGQ